MYAKMNPGKLLLILLVFLPICLVIESVLKSNTGVGGILTSIAKYFVFLSAMFFVLKILTASQKINVKTLPKWLLQMFLLSLSFIAVGYVIMIALSHNIILAAICGVIIDSIFIFTVFIAFALTFEKDFLVSFKKTFLIFTV